MGSLVGGIIGGIGSLVGGATAAAGEQKASRDALTGFNYLTNNPLINQAQANGSSALAGEANTTGALNSLLTSDQSNSPAYQNYLNSTGYNFQMQQGQNAITGNAASKGLLNSGATAKALTSYGQNLASTTYGNYLSQMGSLAGLQGAQAQQGLGAAGAVGNAGTTGGIAQGNLYAQGAQSLGTSIAQAGNYIGGGTAASMNNGSIPNFFSSAAAAPSLYG
jgi:hypothetical protein